MSSATTIRWSATAHAARLRNALHKTPGFGFGQRQTGGAMGEPKRLANLALCQRLLPRHQVGVDAGDCRGHTPGRAHLAPGICQLAADLLGDGAGGLLGLVGLVGHGQMLLRGQRGIVTP